MNLLLVIFIFFQSVQQNPADKIVGMWRSEDGKSTLEVLKINSTYSVKVIEVTNPLGKDGTPVKDKNNPDKTLQSRPIVGLVIVSDLIYKDGFWKGSQIYSPEKGMYADCKIELADKNTIKVIASKGRFSSTKIWKRI